MSYGLGVTGWLRAGLLSTAVIIAGCDGCGGNASDANDAAIAELKADTRKPLKWDGTSKFTLRTACYTDPESFRAGPYAFDAALDWFLANKPGGKECGQILADNWGRAKIEESWINLCMTRDGTRGHASDITVTLKGAFQMCDDLSGTDAGPDAN